MTPMKYFGDVVREWVDNAIAFSDHHATITIAGAIVFMSVTYAVAIITDAAIRRSTR